MNITVGTMSAAFSISTGISESRVISDPRSRIASEAIHGMVTRWKNSPRLASTKLKLWATSAPNESFTAGTSSSSVPLFRRH